MTQKERIFDAVRLNGGSMTTNELKRWCVDNFIGCGDRRMRELVTEKKLTSRKMTDAELERYHYYKRVQIYEVKKVR